LHVYIYTHKHAFSPFLLLLLLLLLLFLLYMLVPPSSNLALLE
jgi:hypothetical protein